MKCIDQTIVGECWKDVPGYGGRYQASDESHVHVASIATPDSRRFRRADHNTARGRKKL